MDYVNSFCDKSIKPTEELVAASLGKTFSHWQAIQKYLLDTYGQTTPEWKFYSPKYGWTFKTFLKKRNLFFITISKNCFRIVFIFGDKAVAAIEKSDLPEELISTLLNEKKYAEGRGLSLIVKAKKHVELVKKLIEIKIAN